MPDAGRLPPDAAVMAALGEHPEGTSITLHVQPRSSRTEVAAIDRERVKLRVAAPPVDGAANKEIVNWLGKQLGVSKSSIRILQGEHGRQKVILIPGLTPAEVKTGLGLS